jgi:hypothetical protein
VRLPYDLFKSNLLMFPDCTTQVSPYRKCLKWPFSFIAVFAGGIAATNICWKIWISQLPSCICAIIFPSFMYPEVCSSLELILYGVLTYCALPTGGKTLEEIEFTFAKRRDGQDLSSGVTSSKEEMEASMEEKV